MQVFLAVVCFLASTVSAKAVLEYELSLEEFIASNIRYLESQSESRITANANDYIDNSLEYISNYIIFNGLDPMDIDDLEEGFSVKLGPLTFHGGVTLKNGWLQGLSSIYRNGDSALEYNAKILNLRLPVGLNTMNANYDYKAAIMNLGPSGGIEAKIDGLQIYVDVSVDTKTTEIILQKFEITNAGSISLKFSGNILVDWLSNALVKLLTTVLHKVVINVVEGRVQNLIEDLIQSINDRSIYY